MAPRVVKTLGLIRRTILLFLLFATPLVIAPSFTLDQYNLPKLALLMVAVPVAGAIRGVEFATGPEPFRGRALLVPASLLASALGVAWLLSPHQQWSLWGEFTRLQGLLPYLVVIVFGLLLLDAFHDTPATIAWAIALSGAAAGAVAIYQMLFLGEEIPTLSTTAYVTSTLGHSNFAGGFLAIVLPISVMLWLRGGRGKWVAILFSAVIADALAFTYSQGGWIAAAAGVAAALGIHLSPRRRRAATLGFGLAAILAVGSVVVVVGSQASTGLVTRYPGLGSAETRGFLWDQAIRLFEERPVTGWGPNAFALEAPSRRAPEEALAGGVFFGDDPHSVPLSMAANAGLLGIVAFSYLLVWPVLRGRRRDRTERHRGEVALAAAFTGGLVAYAVQALVSLDEISLRMELWACLAGFAATTGPGSPLRSGNDRRQGIEPLAIAVSLVGIATAVWAARTLVPADRLALAGARAIYDGRIAGGSQDVRRAIELRDAFEYRRTYATALGDAALETEAVAEGGPLIEEMREQYENLRRRGDPHADRNEARYLYAWSLFDPQFEDDSLDLFLRAAEQDPYNLVLAAQTSDVLVQLGRPQEAVDRLRTLVPLLTREHRRYIRTQGNQQFWGALAIAEASAGNAAEARRAIRISESAGGDDCRTSIAKELLEPAHLRRQPPAIGFICPRILLRLLPSRN